MGNVLQSAAELNPLTAVANTVKSVCHDFNVYFLNACSTDCDCCGCFKWSVNSTETHDDPVEETPIIGLTWHT